MTEEGTAEMQQPENGSNNDKKHHNPFDGLVAGFKKLGDKMKGGESKGNGTTEQPAPEKSHRFSDLLHLHKEVKRDLSDSTLYPELQKDAELRRNNELSEKEIDFRNQRKQFIVQNKILHKFLQLDQTEIVHPDDVPIIGLGGSGGGYRACLGFLAYIEEMQSKEEGLWDLIMYVAGVSGSCWTIGGLYSVANMNATGLLDRFARSSAHHPLSATAIDAVARSANGVYFQLAPILQKIRVGHLHPGPLDLYGTLVTSHSSESMRTIATITGLGRGTE